MFHFQNIIKLNVKNGFKCQQLFSSNVENKVSSVFRNRNPRNLEKMRIGYKPDGYHVEKPGKCYWHK